MFSGAGRTSCLSRGWWYLHVAPNLQVPVFKKYCKSNGTNVFRDSYTDPVIPEVFFPKHNMLIKSSKRWSMLLFQKTNINTNLDPGSFKVREPWTDGDTTNIKCQIKGQTACAYSSRMRIKQWPNVYFSPWNMSGTHIFIVQVITKSKYQSTFFFFLKTVGVIPRHSIKQA